MTPARDPSRQSCTGMTVLGGAAVPFHVPRFAHRASNVIHLLLEVPRLVDVFDELLEGHLVEDVVGRLGEFLVEEGDRDLAGRAVLADVAVLQSEPPLEPADDVADADLARGT